MGQHANPVDRFDELQRHPVPGGEVVRHVLAWTEDGVPAALMVETEAADAH